MIRRDGSVTRTGRDISAEWPQQRWAGSSPTGRSMPSRSPMAIGVKPLGTKPAQIVQDRAGVARFAGRTGGKSSFQPATICFRRRRHVVVTFPLSPLPPREPNWSTPMASPPPTTSPAAALARRRPATPDQPVLEAFSATEIWPPSRSVPRRGRGRAVERPAGAPTGRRPRRRAKSSTPFSDLCTPTRVADGHRRRDRQARI